MAAKVRILYHPPRTTKGWPKSEAPACKAGLCGGRIHTLLHNRINVDEKMGVDLKILLDHFLRK